MLINGKLTNQLLSMPKASLYAQFSNQYNSPLPWFRWVILISHRVYHRNPTAVHLDDLIIISGKLVVEQGIFHQERLHDLINLGMARFFFFFFLAIIYNLGNEHVLTEIHLLMKRDVSEVSNTFSIFFYALLGNRNFVITEKISQ